MPVELAAAPTPYFSATVDSIIAERPGSSEEAVLEYLDRAKVPLRKGDKRILHPTKS